MHPSTAVQQQSTFATVVESTMSIDAVASTGALGSAGVSARAVAVGDSMTVNAIDVQGRPGAPGPAGATGATGPAGAPGTSTPGDGGHSSAGVFILDITAGGVVGAKAYSPDGKVLLSCASDTALVRVWVGAEGDATNYTPSVSVNGVVAALTESSTRRWFLGYADVTLADLGNNTINAVASTGASYSSVVNRLAGGPSISSITFGPYPGTQTALKAGDVVTITITADLSGAEVTLLSGGLVTGGPFAVVNGTASGSITIGAFASGAATFTAKAKNGFGTYGDERTTPALAIDQTSPTFGSFNVAYPGGKGALGAGDTASVGCVVAGADVVVYGTTGLTVTSGYATTKSALNAATGYVNAGTNYTITAVRVANGATATASALVKIATVAPTASISLLTPRLDSSPTGIDHEIRITPSQTLSVAPTLSASVGVWQGAWVSMGSYWKRSLRVSDSVPRGAGLFSALAMTGLSGISGSTITAGASYVIGGLSTRVLTFTAFARVTALGAAVGDQTKTSALIVGGNTLTRNTSNASLPNGYFIANAGGAYDPNGGYLGMSDASLAGANTGGTLQASFTESP